MKKFWQRADISVEGDVAVQQSIRFNMFHLFQSAGRDGKTSIAAKGLTGEGYGGQYFWDTEIFIHPFFYIHVLILQKSFLNTDTALLMMQEKGQDSCPRRVLYFPGGL